MSQAASREKRRGIWCSVRCGTGDPTINVEGPAGSLRVDEQGRLLVQTLGETPREHDYVHQRQGFAGDCCYRAIQHFVDRLHDGAAFETPGRDYLRTLAVQEALYQSAATGQTVRIEYP